MKNICYTILFSLLIIERGLACSCIPAPSFCDVSKESLAVLEVEVLKIYKGSENSYTHFVDFDVKNTLSSVDPNSYDHLTLMEAGSTCDLFLHAKLKKGDRLIINYDQVRENPEANYPIIYFSSCSNNYLALEKNNVIGKITNPLSEEEQTMSYMLFKKNLNDLCGLNGFSEKSVEIANNLVDAYIDLKNNHPTKLSFHIYSSTGQLVYNGEIDSYESTRLLLEGFPSDLYFIRFSNRISQHTHKFLKVR